MKNKKILNSKPEILNKFQIINPNIKQSFRISYLLFFILIICGNVFADTLYLKNGTQFIGRVIKQDAEKVIFRIGTDQDGADITFFSDQVLRIDKAEVSSFITLPMGQGKQINIPRPTFNKEPLLTEQARTQQEKRHKAEESRQAEIKLEEGYKTNTTQNENKQSGDLSKMAESELSLKQKNVMEELMPFLNKEEKDYFSKINSMAKEPANNVMQILGDPAALTPNSDNMIQMIKDMSSQTEDIIKQLSSLEPPQAFVNFQKKYLDNLALIRDVFLGISKGEVADTQSKIAKLQNMNNQLQEELAKILNEKKK